MLNFSRSSRSPAVTKGGTIYYPYFLAYATGALEKAGFDVKLVDTIANEWSPKETIKFVKEFSPDLVVVDTSTPSIYNDVKVAAEIKKAVPNAHVSLVGTHPTRATNETFKLSKHFDSICRGEYDYTVVDLARALEKSKSLKRVKGLSFREKRKIIHNKDRPLIKNLDELPFVSEVYKRHFGIEGIKKYFYASVKHPQVTILTTRGCPHNCSFCNIPFKGSYRTRSPKNVVKEFEFISSELPEVKEVMLEDDTFPIIKKRTLKICDMLIKRKMKLAWSCNVRVNTDFETLKKMKQAGCRLLCVGFESAAQKVLNNVHKGTTKDRQIQFMKDTKKIDLLVNGCVVLGLPGDTEETIRETVEFTKELNPDTMQFYPPFAYPGVELWNWAKKEGYLVSEDYSKLLTKSGLHMTNISMPGLSSKKLFTLCDQALQEYYLRPRYISMKLKQVVTNFDEAKRTFIAAVSKGFLKRLIMPESYR